MEPPGVNFDPEDPDVRKLLREAGVDVSDKSNIKRLLESLGSAAKKPKRG